MTLIYLAGILAGLLVAVVWIELPHLVPASKAAQNLAKLEEEAPKEEGPTGWRSWLTPAEKPVARFTPAGILRSVEANLYWCHFQGLYKGWSAIQIVTLELAAFVVGFLVFLFATRNFVFSPMVGFALGALVHMRIANPAAAARKRIQAELPEFVNLVYAFMAANNSIDQALVRASKAPNLMGRWMKHVIESAQARSVLEEIMREATKSRLSELITFAVQLSFVQRGTNQKELMQMASRTVSSAYTAGADKRAANISSDLTVFAGLTFFVPFVLMVVALQVAIMLLRMQ